MYLKKHRSLISYTLYDAGNSNYATLISSIAFPIYFKTTVARDMVIGDALWGAMILVSTIIAAFMGPRIGEIADRRALRHTLLRWTTWLAIVGTAALYFLSSGQVALAVILFLLTNTAFLLAVLLYDSLLVEVTSPKNAGMISSIAWAVGYAGGLIGLLIALTLRGDQSQNLRFSFLIGALLFLIFSLPITLNRSRTLHRESNPIPGPEKQSLTSIVRAFMKDKTRSRLFWAYFMYSNGISAVIYFTSIYAMTSLGYTLERLLWLFVLMSLVAVPSVFIFGKLSVYLGHITTLRIVVASWVLIIVAAAFANASNFAIVACIAASFLGPAQALSRSLFRIVFPSQRMTSYFGVQALASRSSALIGPIVFGVTSSATGSQRTGVLATVLLVIVGFLLLMGTTFDENGEHYE